VLEIGNRKLNLNWMYWNCVCKL